jgi:hypothetical protein
VRIILQTQLKNAHLILPHTYFPKSLAKTNICANFLRKTNSFLKISRRNKYFRKFLFHPCLLHSFQMPNNIKLGHFSIKTNKLIKLFRLIFIIDFGELTKTHSTLQSL